MADKPNNPPAAPSGPYEDYRVTVARKALIESAEAKGTDRSAFQIWGYLEGTVKSLLEVIDEGRAVAPTGDLPQVDLEALSDDELVALVDAQLKVFQPLVDELQRRRPEPLS
jgi:hypothetical protein